ncbi:MAG TPA: triple tyrosine motif-containing protein, partial [Bacteroidales bacterium]|nr:triple tyrosine motif-containing protein [Bacteroidales bacterium]
FVLLMLLLLWPIPAMRAQEPERKVTLPVSAYNVEQGLDQSTVNQVFQDHRGLIWVTTGDGLQCFDGTGFRSFKPPVGQAFAMTGNLIRDICETAPGSMVLSTRSSLLGFDSHTGKFSLLVYDNNRYPWVSGVAFRDGVIGWVAREGLCLIGKSGVEPIRFAFECGISPPGTFMPLQAVKDGLGRIILSGQAGFVRVDESRARPGAAPPACWIPFRQPCQSIAVAPGGAVFGLSGGTIGRLDDHGEWTPVFNTGLKDLQYLYIDRQSNFWVSDFTHKRVLRVRQGNPEEILFLAREGSHGDTIRPIVRTITEDRRGNFWFGTDGQGLLFHSPDHLTFDLSLIGFTRCIASFAGDIWAGTFRNGLWRLSSDLSVARRVSLPAAHDDFSYLDLASDPAGRLWVASDKGLFILGKDGNVVSHQAFTTSRASFFRLPGNRLFLSTYESLYRCETGSSPGLKWLHRQTYLRDLISLQDHFWICNAYGLYRTDTVFGLLPSLERDGNCHLNPSPVNCILAEDRLIWTGTERGIVCYRPSGEELPLPPALKPLGREVIYSLLADQQHRIWFSGNKGVGMIPRERDRIIRFNLLNNLQSNEFNSNADLRTDDGRIYFGGIRGINGLRTVGFSPARPAPGVSLLSLSVADTLYRQGIPGNDLRLILNRDRAHFSGTVFTPDYLAAGTAFFSFFLEGYQDRWTAPSNANTFAFRSLPPGTYTLYARCADGYGNQGPSCLLLCVTIHPPFWKTAWFLVLVLFTSVAATILMHNRIQGVRYRKRLAELERRNVIDRERLRISQDMHDEVGASLTQIAILSELVRKKRDDPAGMMKLIDRISGISSTVVDDMSEIIWAMNPRNDSLDSFASYLRQYASGYLSDAGLGADLRFPGDLPELLMTSEQRRDLFLVVKEALHNIVKHAGATRAGLTLEIRGERLSLLITDNGRGFDPAVASPSGNGRINMRRRVEALGGILILESVPGKGTTLQISVTLASG